MDSKFHYAREVFGATESYKVQYVRFTSTRNRDLWISKNPHNRFKVRANDPQLRRHMDPIGSGFSSRIVTWSHADGINYMNVYKDSADFSSGITLTLVS